MKATTVLEKAYLELKTELDKIEKMQKILDSLKSYITSMLLNVDESELNKPYLSIGDKGFSRIELANEVKNETEIGTQVMENLVELTIDLIKRNKKSLNETPEQTNNNETITKQ